MERCWSIKRPLSLFFVTVIIQSLTTILPACGDTTINQSNKEEDVCTLYLAPSTILGAGLGIFTAIDLKKDDLVGKDIGDVVIPIVDYGSHHDYDSGAYWPFYDYIWEGRHMGMNRESKWAHKDGIQAYVPGLDCAINCHLGLINVDKQVPDILIPDHNNANGKKSNLPHRSRHAMAGSMTPYENATTIALVDIPAGSELFKAYGDHWFTSRFEQFGFIPLTDDYFKAQTLAERFVQIFTSFKNKDITTSIQMDLYQLMTSWNSRIINALPRIHNANNTEYILSKIQQIAKEGIKSIYQSKAMRYNLHSWNKARCLDVIQGRPSTIPNAGRGAFVKRSFQKNEIITGTPLLHFTNPSLMEIYDTADGTVFGHQLVKNYCWSRHDTNITLCPYGAGVNLINHAPTRTTTSDEMKQTANVKFQWAPHGQVGHDDDVLHYTLSQLEQVKISKLAWDLIALRNIEPDEELFLDYGDEWENAFQIHLKHWEQQHAKDVQYKPAVQWNRQEYMLRTKFEEPPYPSNVELHCHEWFDRGDILNETYEELWSGGIEGSPCIIYDRQLLLLQQNNKNETTTTNNTSQSNSKDPAAANKEELPIYIYTIQLVGQEEYVYHNVPRKVISFMDTYYSTDIHMPNVFRQEATIPNDLLPPQWKTTSNEDEDKEDQNESKKETENGVDATCAN